ncbi:MAG: hypothetical protein GY700_06605 [Propionibacteriaceae bacterium]|nr:hypothetical protein [Propionibacteriaceae bacterium]
MVLSPIANNTVESFTAELIEHFRDFIEMLEDEETEESINELLFAALENTCTGRA